jgi:hypothetical protein
MKDGHNQDVGEIDEAHLRTYVASLPGSYAVPKREGMSRTFASKDFADAVQNRARRLASENTSLSDLEAFRLATSQILKSDPSWLAAYRKDVRETKRGG